jgi:Tol biopolymer transport system component
MQFLDFGLGGYAVKVFKADLADLVLAPVAEGFALSSIAVLLNDKSTRLGEAYRTGRWAKRFENVNVGSSAQSIVMRMNSDRLTMAVLVSWGALLDRLQGDLDTLPDLREYAGGLAARFSEVVRRDVSVTERLAELQDSLILLLSSPSEMGVLVALAQQDGTIRVSFTAPGSGGGVGGRVHHYRLQYWDTAFNPSTVNLDMVGWDAGKFPAIAAPGQTESVTFAPDRRRIHAGQTCYLALAAYDDSVEDVANRSPITFASVVVPANPSGIELVNLRVDPPASQQGPRSYRYSVQYAHANAAPPEVGWPRLFIDGAQVLGGVQQVGTDYRNGVEFAYETTRDFSVAAHEFTWKIKADGLTHSVTSVGPQVSGHLLASGARQISGNTYVFFTTWRDAQGRTPDSARLYRRYGATKVDIADMHAVGGEPLSGVRYEFGPWTLHHETDYRYYFEFLVGGTTYRDPPNPADFFTGLVTKEVIDVTVRDLRIEPPKLVGGQTATILADLFNLGSNRERNLLVRATINGVQLGNAVTVDELSWAGTASNYRERIPFSWPMPLGDNSSNYVVSVEVDVRPGETSTANNSVQQAVTVTPPPGAISGYVLDFQGAPIKGATIKIVAGPEFGSTESGVFSQPGSTETNPEGFYVISGLPPGQYGIEASAAGSVMKLHNIAVHAGTEIANQNFQFTGIVAQQITHPQLSCEHHTSPSWSPGGNRIVFQTSKTTDSPYEQILIANADGTGTATRLTGTDKVNGGFGTDEGRDPEWSPDGARILFAGHQRDLGGYGIYVANANGNGTDAHRLVAYAWSPTWAPDSQRFAYYNSAGGGVWIYSFATGTPTQLSDTGMEGLSWSPDGSKLAGDGTIFDAVNGTVIYTFSGAGGSGRSPTWLRDSSGIVYQQGDDVYVRVLADFDQAIPVLTAEGVHEWNPAVSPDGGTLCFTSNRGLGACLDGLFVTPFAFARLLIKDVRVNTTRLTPDGDGTNDTVAMMYKLTTPANVTAKIYASDGSITRKLAISTPETAGTNQVMWDGADDQGRLAKDGIYHLTLDAVDAAGNVSFPQIVRLNLAKGFFSTGVLGVLSHDGTRLAYANASGVVLRTRSGGEQTILDFATVGLQPPPGTERAFDWSPDDSKICFAAIISGNYQIFIVGTNGSGPAQLTFAADDGRYHAQSYKPSWSPVANEIVYLTRRDTGGGVYTVNIGRVNGDGTGKTVLTSYATDEPLSCAGRPHPAWTADGTGILFSMPSGDCSSTHDIWRMNRDGGSPTKIVEHPFGDYYPTGVDEGQVAWLSQRQTSSSGPFDLWIQHLDGSAKWALWQGVNLDAVTRLKVLPGGFEIYNGGGDFIELFQSVTLGQVIGSVAEPSTSGLSPVAGALVQAIVGANVVGEAFSGADGKFQIFNVPPASYSVAARKTGYRLGSSANNLGVQANVVSSAGAVNLLRLPDTALTIDRASTHVRGEVVLHAEPTGGAVASVEFAYSFSGSSAWAIIGTVTNAPFEVVWDTSALIIAGQERPVLVRAIARDAGGFSDDEPPVLNLTLDGLAPTARASLPPGSKLSLGARVVVSAIQANPDLSAILFEIRRQGETGWRTIGVGSATNPSAILDTGDLIGGQTYELRARAIDEAGNTDSTATAATFSVVGPVSLSALLVGDQIVLTWPANPANFILIGTDNLAASPSTWPAVLPPPVVVNGKNVVTNAMTNSTTFYQLRTQ